MSQKIIWLRSETKTHERRTPLIPEHAAQLVRDNHTVIVERYDERIFKDSEYADVGCELVAPGTWSDAPLDAAILGIKELPTSTTPLKHHHIYFAHAYKGQDGAKQLLNRFERGHGMLYDLEFLRDDKNQRLASFSYWAGVAGCAVTLLLWIQKQQQSNKALSIPEFYPDETALIELLAQKLSQVDRPLSLVIGPRGRCGRGVIHLLKKLELDMTLWYRVDTVGDSRHHDIMQHDLLFNCVYLTKKIAPFITKEQLSTKGTLSLIADISCDPNSSLNPLPIYDKITTFKKPTVRVCDDPHSIDVMAIDHLPSFLPKESSCDFSRQLFPYLQELLNEGEQSATWKRTEAFYHQHVAELCSRPVPL